MTEYPYPYGYCGNARRVEPCRPTAVCFGAFQVGHHRYTCSIHSSSGLKITQSILTVRVLAVFGELISVRTRKSPKEILFVFPRALTQ